MEKRSPFEEMEVAPLIRPKIPSNYVPSAGSRLQQWKFMQNTQPHKLENEHPLLSPRLEHVSSEDAQKRELLSASYPPFLVRTEQRLYLWLYIITSG
jgi:hypothetical protein